VLLNHVLTQTAWAAACRVGQHAPLELVRDGFLHCCRPEQLPFVLGRHFAGVTGLIVLTFETEDLDNAIRWVSSEPDQAPFPHLYAPIPCSAVRAAAPPDNPSPA